MKKGGTHNVVGIALLALAAACAEEGLSNPPEIEGVERSELVDIQQMIVEGSGDTVSGYDGFCRRHASGGEAGLYVVERLAHVQESRSGEDPVDVIWAHLRATGETTGAEEVWLRQHGRVRPDGRGGGDATLQVGEEFVVRYISDPTRNEGMPQTWMFATFTVEADRLALATPGYFAGYPLDVSTYLAHFRAVRAEFAADVPDDPALGLALSDEDYEARCPPGTEVEPL